MKLNELEKIIDEFSGQNLPTYISRDMLHKLKTINILLKGAEDRQWLWGNKDIDNFIEMITDCLEKP